MTLKFHLTPVQWLSSRKQTTSQALVTHACNPSYSGSRDQEDHHSKPAQANSSMRPYLKKKKNQNNTKKDW
jgi:hypothetical protein